MHGESDRLVVPVKGGNSPGGKEATHGLGPVIREFISTGKPFNRNLTQIFLVCGAAPSDAAISVWMVRTP